MKRRTASALRQTAMNPLQLLKWLINAITSYNGKQFGKHEAIARVLKTRFNFA
ncbi:flagellar motor protein MotB [Methylohalomonas lacus]|uniref:Flagellar motor protein MotB n=1 Tax=Methylohalomonas lacus TaxID=398773 RepID=A0AAE3HLC5_9GAMM|nr:hypothetical protein [Methylohalomonas lacus]MCS3904369.1 flagellar motor protein MotB [Methylohalomonas lacus]